MTSNEWCEMLTPKGLAVSKVVPIFHLLYRVIYGFVFVIAYRKEIFGHKCMESSHIFGDKCM